MNIFSYKNRGFTLIEILVVTGIIAFLSTAIIVTFSRNRVRTDEAIAFLTAQVRVAQTESVSSTKYTGYVPCGYGIHQIDTTHFAIYVGPNAATTDCKTLANKNYSAEDTLLNSLGFQDTRVEIKGGFSDIFFVPPDPKTYINNSAAPSTSETITLGTIGTSCPTYCKSITVSTSGKINEN